MWEISCCLHPHKQICQELPFFKNKSEQNCTNVSLAHSHQTTKRPWMHPPEQKTYFLSVFKDAYPKISKCDQDSTPLQMRIIFNKSPSRYFQNQQLQTIIKCPKQYLGYFHLTPFLPPHPLNPYFCNAKKRWQASSSQMDKYLTVHRAKGGQLTNSEVCIYVYIYTYLHV